MHYYETYTYNYSGDALESDGIDLKGSCTAHGFENFEEAVEFANENNCEIIQEIGSSFDEYAKCQFCGEWDLLYTIDNNNGVCDRCKMALYSRGEKW